MQRTIKFRGKRVDNGEWVFGYLKYNNEINHYYVKPETVGQFTGLTDKNGKEIYEGDIINCYDKSAKEYSWGLDKEHKGELVFLDGAFILKCNIGKEKVMGNVDVEVEKFIFLDKWLNAEISEIIGNIHDNPELLK